MELTLRMVSVLLQTHRLEEFRLAFIRQTIPFDRFALVIGFQGKIDFGNALRLIQHLLIELEQLFAFEHPAILPHPLAKAAGFEGGHVFHGNNLGFPGGGGRLRRGFRLIRETERQFIVHVLRAQRDPVRLDAVHAKFLQRVTFAHDGLLVLLHIVQDGAPVGLVGRPLPAIQEKSASQAETVGQRSRGGRFRRTGSSHHHLPGRGGK
jgi:hypothetical protein